MKQITISLQIFITFEVQNVYEVIRNWKSGIRLFGSINGGLIQYQLTKERFTFQFVILYREGPFVAKWLLWLQMPLLIILFATKQRLIEKENFKI